MSKEIWVEYDNEEYLELRKFEDDLNKAIAIIDSIDRDTFGEIDFLGSDPNIPEQYYPHDDVYSALLDSMELLKYVKKIHKDEY